jgi:tetratricopeptide (TPR) repeat protein
MSIAQTEMQHRTGAQRRPLRARVCCGWLAAALILLVTWPVAAQETPESRAFKSAARAFQDGAYDVAERSFGQFVTAFPQSPMLHEAVLLQAQAAVKLTNLNGAVSILNAHVARAGLLTDQYRYWLATAYLQGSNYAAAADSFALIPRQFTNSPLLLEAGHGEALARFRLRDFDRVIALLQTPNGAFQQAAKARPNDELTIRGHLLLAEALVEKKQYRAAEAEVLRLAETNLPLEFRWDRQYLLGRIQSADQRLADALVSTTNLVSLATETARPGLVADSVALQAGILRQMNRLDDALQVYTNNLAEAVPLDRQRLALLNIIELILAQNRTEEAGRMLESFLSRQPDDAASEVVLLTSGELHLKLHLNAGSTNHTLGASEPDTATNHLQLALGQFEKLRTLSTNNLWRGKALLNIGWCHWLDQKIPESLTAFRAAVEALPFSEDLAVARFKLADALQRQGDAAGALREYRALTNDFARLPRVRETLFDQALFQIVRTSIGLGDEAAAAAALSQMLDRYPESSLSGRSVWLVGQELIRVNRPADARAIFSDFVRRFPGRSIQPKIDLAIARTYFREGNWPLALTQYEEWLARYPTNELRPRAEFNLAWTNDKAGRRTNALQLFTNIVARYPTNELAPQAQNWVAEELYRQGNYREALINFQTILENTNWPATNLTFQARMMAGRSAYAAQLWKNADDHFTRIINDPGQPDELVAEAWFALGDTRRNQESAPGGPAQRFIEARKAYSKIPQLHPNSPLVPLAWGSIGDCALQLAAQDAREYESATNAYWRVITNGLADIAVRSQAEYGLGRALELQAAAKPAEESAGWLFGAFEHYYNIVVGSNLRAGDQPDPFWVEKAGMAAARLKEEQKQWTTAVRIYERLHEVLPPLRPRLQDKMNKARELLRKE